MTGSPGPGSAPAAGKVFLPHRRGIGQSKTKKEESSVNMDEMTRKERLLAAMRREPCDRLPTQIDFSPKMLDIMCDKFGKPRRGEEELLEVTDNHLVYGFLNDTFGMIRKRQVPKERIAYDSWGCGFDMEQEGISPAAYPLADFENAIRTYRFPDPNAPGLTNWAEAAVKKYGRDYVVCSYQVTLMLERMEAMCGYQNCLTTLADPDLEEEVEILLDGIADYQAEMAKRYIRLGVGCGRTGDDYGSQIGMMISPGMWRRLFKPRLKKIVEVYKDAGLPVIHHSCGNVLPIIPDLIEIGIDVLNNVQPEAMDRKEVAKFKGRITFYGGISTQQILPHGTEEEIYEEVKATLDDFGHDTGVILSPGISVVSDVPIKNVNALMTAFNELAGAHYTLVRE